MYGIFYEFRRSRKGWLDPWSWQLVGRSDELYESNTCGINEMIGNTQLDLLYCPSTFIVLS